MATAIWAIGLVVFATFIGSVGALFFKFGADRLHRQIRLLFTNWQLALGIVLYVLSTLFFLAGLSGGELSVIYPFTALTYVWICFMSTRFLDEEMNWIKWGGIVLILIGVGLIGSGA
ncbi:EamA family transporter [Candidatus Woesearchaeota archaeon]|nr:EamA family transporter [Candidatus Woesearchaeota archaeon]